MLSEELSTDMDRITQLQDAILDLLTICHTSIEYITKRTQFEQNSNTIPATLHTNSAAKRKDYKAAIETFVADIIQRSKDVELLIAALPKKEDSDARAGRIEELQREMDEANGQYKEALADAESLLKELEAALGEVLDDPVIQGVDDVMEGKG
ncbi:hypothetical protein BD324DRAFT_84233 [Kockovaella imperatae]|uniref:Mediator of RNA polymerase II transcription subunit 21 n=1 Tax=Kockovaella imperatae TaxID=4999 RepID=A0A1Y1UB57_9TREE|nr:hypothetical protein BD324DRAFT_84233 [Kockovaella imperatae]ORX35249.1 hypothetical protein BD324DRAFT_84233 [Kockovaella imperatae]